MRVRFIEPPPALRVGGLEGAIRSLEHALRHHGVEVTSGEAEAPRPDEIFHFHGLWRPADSRLSTRLRQAGRPFIVSPHGMLEPWAWRHKWWKKWPYYLLIERRHLQRANAVLATAPQEAERLRRFLPRQRIDVLPLGFTGEAKPDYSAARSKLGWAADEVVLLFLSRLHAKKGLELLLRALHSVALPTTCRLVIVGGGESSYVNGLKRLAASLKLPRVEWIGEIWGDDRWPYFQGADLFCLPSHSENFGLAVLEACQVGTPALTTHTTPWGEWLQPARGIVVEPTESGVREGLIRFFNQARRTTVERAGLAEWASSRFAWTSLAPRYVQLYTSLFMPPSETVAPARHAP
jgi:glycosyltransferase involved in cell wall biosynthesis